MLVINSVRIYSFNLTSFNTYYFDLCDAYFIQVDAIEHYQELLEDNREQWKKEKEKIKQSPTGIAFITFENDYLWPE